MIKRADGRWQQAVTVNINGTRKVKTFYGKTKAEVNRKMAEWKASPARISAHVFADVADEWWEQHEPTLAANTSRSYRPAYIRAREHFEKAPVESIRPSDVNTFLFRFIASANPAMKTAKTQLMVCNLIFRYAVQHGYIEANPTTDVELPKNLKKDRRDISSDDDIARVKSGCDAPFGMFAYWILYTGLRRGELLALRWEDVDLANRTITVSRSCFRDTDGKMKVKSPKTESGVRTIPLMNKLAEKITPGTGLIFPGDKPGSFMTNGMFERHWRHYVDATGVTCTPHQLRHAYATMLYENGDKISMEDAQYLLGHANISTTKDIYTHIRDYKKERIKKSMLDIDIA